MSFRKVVASKSINEVVKLGLGDQLFFEFLGKVLLLLKYLPFIPISLPLLDFPVLLSFLILLLFLHLGHQFLIFHEFSMFFFFLDLLVELVLPLLCEIWLLLAFVWVHIRNAFDLNIVVRSEADALLPQDFFDSWYFEQEEWVCYLPNFQKLEVEYES